ncbi:RNA-directed DNA polymerase from mobile element jockey [Plakobranchus ocellatus]|uniref:RNA-directed DNA polymerase from mobile element jockey n=1 Tax=Plakobranchus ocellatus TaxID=259542 RepID=A0AAV4B0B7_9GAST|nr:RNA-directed DNA polymerase from mobile element jockey [Plakobranchus ocellatus]
MAILLLISLVHLPFDVIRALPSILSPRVVLIPSICDDDFAIHAEGKHLQHLERTIQLCINNVQEWVSEDGFRFSVSKTTCVHFHRQRIYTEPALHLDGQPIPVKVPSALGGAQDYVDVSLAKQKKEDNSEMAYRKEFFRIREKFSNHYAVFTDGSKLEEKVAAAAYFPEHPDRSKATRLTDRASVFSAELEGIALALTEFKKTH